MKRPFNNSRKLLIPHQQIIHTGLVDFLPLAFDIKAYKRIEAMADLDIAIQQYQEAVDTTPVDHRGRTSRVQDLGVGYGNRYQREGAIVDLEIAIQRYQ